MDIQKEEQGRSKFSKYRFLCTLILCLSISYLYYEFHNLYKVDLEISEIEIYSNLEKEKDLDFIEFEINLEENFFIPVLFMTFNFYDNLGKVSYERVILSTGTKEDSKYFLKDSFFDEIFELYSNKISSTKIHYELKFIDLPQYLTNQNKRNTGSLEVYIRHEHKDIHLALEDIHKKSTFIGEKILKKIINFSALNEKLSIIKNFNKFWFFTDFFGKKIIEKNYNFNYKKYLSKCQNLNFNLVETFDKQPINLINTKKEYETKNVDVFFIGDSQISGTCVQVRNNFNISGMPYAEFDFKYYKIDEKHSISVKCYRHTGQITKNFTNYKRRHLNFLNLVLEEKEKLNNKNKNIFFINFSGLWDAAYAIMNINFNSDLYRDKVNILINETFNIFNNKNNSLVYFISTTRIQSILDVNVKQDKKKFTKNQPRVEFVNKIFIEEFNKIQKKHINTQNNIKYLDTGALSKVSLTDNLVKSDTIHLGFTTNRKLLIYQFCESFYEDF